ncbi:citrate synthase [Methanobrevibacter cuticularis]|uniref:Citrate synthase n=1 Tax=Methanobrevibacter cuticularis TaxID=47311 RepID=A0A166DGE6_9EURY|nr:citryl-CoA lyase [Methanobrevibacter cuticularis]KZX15575.1 citrate synthase [Methanobrevibacter cuticularis]
MVLGEKPLKNALKDSESKLRTGITKVEPNKLITRGYSQEDLISKLSYSEMVYLLLKGEIPSKKVAKMFNHVLVSFCDHGVTPPSTQTARLVASSGSPLNVALSGGLLSFGKNHAGAIEKSMELFQSSIENSEDIEDNEINKIASFIVENSLNNKKKIPGFGHRYHNEDPRRTAILKLAFKEELIGTHIKLALAIENLLMEKKNVKMNIDGANAAILSDMGFAPQDGTGIFIIGRLPGLIAHINEEVNEEAEFRKFCDIDDIFYHGNKNRILD